MQRRNLLITIDPGNDSGVACFVDGALYTARAYNTRECVAFGPLLNWLGSLNGFDCKAVGEMPEIYTGRSNPVDILKLAKNLGRWQEALGARGFTWSDRKPGDWKGQVSKPIHHRRVLATLTSAERELADRLPKATAEHALDAIGLGLVTLLRMR